MRIGILGFVAGASWLQMQGALPDFPALLVGAFLLAACGLVPHRWLRRWPARPASRLVSAGPRISLSARWRRSWRKRTRAAMSR